MPQRSLGLFLFPCFWIALEIGKGSIDIVQESVPLVMLNRFIKNGLHRLPFLLGECAKHGFRARRDANIGIFESLHKRTLLSWHNTPQKCRHFSIHFERQERGVLAPI
jgi:hypothetical protein